jgi:spore germination cell wall hydrolase CwlJ-like protein
MLFMTQCHEREIFCLTIRISVARNRTLNEELGTTRNTRTKFSRTQKTNPKRVDYPMTNKSFEAIRRADHALVGVLALFIATISAATGAAAVYRPHTPDQQVEPKLVRIVAAKPAPTADEVAAKTPKTSVIDASELENASAKISLQDQAMQELMREHRCLSDALYYEARGEGKQGEMAIAEVIFHRLRKGTYGRSICSVVYAGAPRHGCQFSFACDGISLRRARAYGAWQHAQYLAAQILVGQARMMDITGGATNFHAISAAPGWAYEMERTAQIGNHIFYKHLPRSRPL